MPAVRVVDAAAQTSVRMRAPRCAKSERLQRGRLLWGRPPPLMCPGAEATYAGLIIPHLCACGGPAACAAPEVMPKAAGMSAGTATRVWRVWVMSAPLLAHEAGTASGL